MIIGMLLLGMLSIVLAFYWYRKAIQIDRFVSALLERLGEPDISGRKYYTDCGSYQWAMKNIVYGDYQKSTEGFRNFMMNRTMTGTLILSSVVGIIPVLMVYLLFQSYQLIGTSLILVILSVFILQGSGGLETSNQLFQWQIEQDHDTLTVGDLAYTKVSKKIIDNWIQKLLIIGIVCISLAPWGESIVPALAYVFTFFLGFIYVNTFVPISIYSMPLALIIFFAIVPAVLSLGIIGARSMHRKSKKENEGFRF